MKKNAAGKQKETGIRTQKQAYLFLAPSLIILTVFVFVPLVGAIAISLMNINIYMNDISFAGLKNYLKMFTDAMSRECDVKHILLCIAGGAAPDWAGTASGHVYDEKYKGSQIDANDLLSSICMLDDGSEHHVVDAFE